MDQVLVITKIVSWKLMAVRFPVTLHGERQTPRARVAAAPKIRSVLVILGSEHTNAGLLDNLSAVS